MRHAMLGLGFTVSFGLWLGLVLGVGLGIGLGVGLGAGLIIEFASVRDGLIIALTVCLVFGNSVDVI